MSALSNNGNFSNVYSDAFKKTPRLNRRKDHFVIADGPTGEELFETYCRLSPTERTRRFWTPARVARFMLLTPGRIRQMIDEGTLPAFRLGHRWLVDMETVKARLEATCNL